MNCAGRSAWPKSKEFQSNGGCAPSLLYESGEASLQCGQQDCEMVLLL